MKHLTLIPFILTTALVLSACGGSAPIQAVETATKPAASETAAPPTATFTPEPTPTEARDPSIPAEYTKDASGNYTKVVDGITVTWDKERNAGYSLMFNNHLLDVRPELDGSTMLDGKTKLSDQLELRVYIDAALTNWNKVSVTHEENMDPCGTMNSESLIFTFLLGSMTWNGMITGPTDYNLNEWYNPGYMRHYTTLEGPQFLHLTNGNVSTVHIRADYEALKADAENNHFTEVVGGPLHGPVMRYMVKVFSDERGNTITEIAPRETDALAWNDERIIEMYLLGFSNALNNPDDPMEPGTWHLAAKWHTMNDRDLISSLPGKSNG